MAQALAALRHFFRLESAGGLTLMITAALAMLIANGPLAGLYQDLLDMRMGLSIGALTLNKPLSLWINDGLMAVFFFLVGMEIKRELLDGQLASRERALLPLVAAVGGMAVPALIYAAINTGHAEAMRGWAIPSATDIAFSLGVLALFGRRVPLSLKVFLTAVAVIDDLGAVIIIALFYTENLSLNALLIALACLTALLLLNYRSTRYVSLYMFVGLILWVAVLKSGVHATIAGVLLGFMIPHRVKNTQGVSLLKQLEHGLHPWVAFGILPLFAFANAGVSLDGLTFAHLLDPVPLGIALGLFVGKQIGIVSFTFLAVRTGIASMPGGANWLQIYAIAVLCGIGFTMSLFIGNLAFDSELLATETRIGVMVGSLLSAFYGAFLLHRFLPRQQQA